MRHNGKKRARPSGVVESPLMYISHEIHIKPMRSGIFEQNVSHRAMQDGDVDRSAPFWGGTWEALALLSHWDMTRIVPKCQQNDCLCRWMPMSDNTHRFVLIFNLNLCIMVRRESLMFTLGKCLGSWLSVYCNKNTQWTTGLWKLTATNSFKWVPLG